MDQDKVGKYSITAKIGQGAMGEVYKAHDPILNRYVAIKTMSAVIGGDDELRKRFLREAQSAARLNHPNIITLFDFGEDQGKIYMAMELLEGNDLKDFIGNQATHLEDKLAFMEQICDGLAFAHSQDVVHRDLKPANIHVQPNGQIKIMDFGLARLGTSEMTRTGMVMGTPHYMSPEQVKGKRADARSDIFSLGAVFYELLSGRKPFDAESLHAVLFQVVEHQPEDLRHWSPEVPNILVQVVDKALAKDPEDRYQHAGQMREALRLVRQVLAGEVDEDHALATLIQPSPGDATVVNDPPGPLVEATVLEPPPVRSGAGRVQGSAALKPSSKFGKTSVPSRTAPRFGTPTPAMRSAARRGAASSRAPAVASTPALPEAPSRMPLYIGGAVAVIAIGIVAAVLMRQPPKPEGGDTGKGGSAQTQMLIDQMVEVARKNLDLKDYKGAAEQAEKVLKLDGGNADAAQVRDQARKTLDDLDAAANEARAAVQAGDTERASRAISRVVEIDPNHPVVVELSSLLNSRFKDKAEKASQEMRSAASGAERAKARLTEIAAASSLAREADALFLKGQFIDATRKFVEARDAYERARRAAVQQAQASTRPPPPPPPPSTNPVITPPSPPQTTLSHVTPPPPTTLSHVTPPPPGPADEEPAVRKVIENYGRALQNKDLALFRSVKPNLSGAEEDKVRASFANKNWTVSISVDSVLIDGNQATVRASRNDTINGKPMSFHQSFVLTKGGGGWTIREIGQ